MSMYLIAKQCYLLIYAEIGATFLSTKAVLVNCCEEGGGYFLLIAFRV